MEFTNKYKKMSIQARAALWFVICNILQRGISFITVPIFTRFLTTEQYGTYSLYASWLSILTIITSLYLYCGVFNNGMTKFEQDRDRYIASMQGLTITITSIVFAIFLCSRKLWNELLGLSQIVIILMFIEMLFTPALQFWSGKQRFDYAYRKLVGVTLFKSILNPFLGIIAVLISDNKANARIFSVVLAEVLVCGTIMIIQFCKGKVFYNKKYWRYALSMAIPLMPHYLSGMILNQGDRIMIDKMVGKSEVAFYSIAYNIGMLVQMVTNAVNNAFTPWVYQKIKAKSYDGIQKTINLLLAMVGVVILGLIIFSPELVKIFGSKEYASAVYVIPPVAASVFFIFLYNILAIPQFYFEKTQFLVISSFVAAAVNIVLNYIFIKKFGYVAAGYTTLTCYILYSLGHYFVSKRVMKSFLPDVVLYEVKIIILMSIIVIIMGILSNFLFPFWYIRYGIILVLSIIMIAKRERIINFITNIRKK